jgi:hypothetical protein
LCLIESWYNELVSLVALRKLSAPQLSAGPLGGAKKGIIMRIVFLILLLPAVLFSQTKSIPMISQKANPGYAWIIQLIQGSTDWDHSCAYRIVVTRSEIYNTVYIEKVTFGEEGCCAKVVSTRKFNLEQFAESFDIKGELAGFEFHAWINPTVFKFKMHDRIFKVSDISKDIVQVEEVK